MKTMAGKVDNPSEEAHSSGNSGLPPEAHPSLARYLMREFAGVVLVVVLLFLPAGRLDWPMGWAFVGLTLAWVSTTALVLVRRHPGLIGERLGPRKGAETWDVAIMSVVGLLTVARLLVAGFDQRYG